MATQVAHTPRKSNMMERWRRLQMRTPRNLSKAEPTATTLSKKVIHTTQQSADTSKDHKAPTSSKPHSRHHEGALDLEILNSKLQQYAQTCSRDDSGPRETEEASAKEPCRVPETITQERQGSEGSDDVEGQTKNNAVKGGADAVLDHEPGATSRQSSHTRASTCPSIIITPPDDDQPPVTEPSDYERFLQQAEDDERTRKAKGLPALPTPKQELPVNPFYSKNPAIPSSVPPQLAEIQETGNEDSHAESDHPSTQHTSSSASSGSNDFAETETQPTRANTASLGRHVSFCEPQKLRVRSDSHGSAYHARGFESPKAHTSVTKRKSLRKLVKDYVRRL